MKDEKKQQKIKGKPVKLPTDERSNTPTDQNIEDGKKVAQDTSLLLSDLYNADTLE